MLATYVLAGTMAGAIAGTATGLLGAVTPESTRIVLGTLLGLAAATLGTRELTSSGKRPLQCDRETPREWVQRGPVLWPLLNGAALGFGATSRLGFWLWYAIPIGCFLLGSPSVGAAIWAAYGFTRTASAGGIWLIEWRRPDADAGWPLHQRERADAMTQVLTLMLGLAMFLLMGL